MDTQTPQRRPQYRILGIVVAVALIVVVLLALAGTNGPGLFTERAAFFGLGVGLLVVSLAVFYMLITLTGVLRTLRAQAARSQELLERVPASAVATGAGYDDATMRRDLADLRRSVESLAARPAASGAAPAMLSEGVASVRKELQDLVARVQRVESHAADGASHERHSHEADAADMSTSRRFRGFQGRPVAEIEGIGPKYSAALEKQGIRVVGELAEANPDQVGASLGITPTIVRQWQAMAELIELKGIGPQFAELLVRSGILSVKALSIETPEGLLAKIQKTNEGREVRIQGRPVGAGLCASWIENAREGRYDAGSMMARPNAA